jgi:hypothetical protein
MRKWVKSSDRSRAGHAKEVAREHCRVADGCVAVVTLERLTIAARWHPGNGADVLYGGRVVKCAQSARLRGTWRLTVTRSAAADEPEVASALSTSAKR